MRMKLKNKFLLCVLVSTMVLLTTGDSVRAACFTSFSDAASLNYSGYTNCQGLAIGTKYAYTAKLNNAKNKTIILRTNMDTGSTICLTNGDTNTSFSENLGHANDMTVCNVNGKSHLFVATTGAASNNFVQLKVDGTKFYKVGSYNFKYNGNPISISGVNILSKATNNFTFLCQSGKMFYIGSVNPNAKSGDINLTQKFKINTKEYSSFIKQGIGYSSGNLYIPLWGGDTSAKPGVNNKPALSVVLVCKNVSAATTGELTPDTALSFKADDNKHSSKFEIEGCGIRNGVLWFNTNRVNKTTNAQCDGLHYFTGYIQ